MKKTVILATYNGSKHIVQQLESILNQLDPVDEVIIVDDQSNDDTLSKIKLYLENKVQKEIQIKIKENPENIGPTKSFLKAISECTSDLIFLSDQDDVWMENKTKLLLEKAKELNNKVPGFCFSDLNLITFQGENLHKSFWQEWNFDPSLMRFRKFIIGNSIPGCSMLINQAMAKELKFHQNTPIKYHDHLIAIIGILFKNYSYTTHSTMKYRIHNNSVTAKLKKNRIRIYKNLIQAIFQNDKEYLKESFTVSEYILKHFKGNLSSKQQRFLEKINRLKNQSVLRKQIFIKFGI